MMQDSFLILIQENIKENIDWIDYKKLEEKKEEIKARLYSECSIGEEMNEKIIEWLKYNLRQLQK